MKSFLIRLLGLLLLFGLLLIGHFTRAQGMGVGTAMPDASAALNVTPTTKEFLPLQMTLDQRGAISSPAAGLVVFQTDQTLSLPGTTVVEFGQGVSGKETNAGNVGYQAFTTGALDIVGAGTAATVPTGSDRRVKIWAEGGLTVQGLTGTGTRLVTATAAGALSTITALAGTGTRVVTADASGALRAYPLLPHQPAQR